MKGIYQSEELVVGGRVKLEWIFGKYGWSVWSGFIWLRMKTCGGLL
jgi:hypothetical protein